MKIIRLHFRNLHNEEWFQLFSKIREQIDKYSPETLGIASLYGDFTT